MEPDIKQKQESDSDIINRLNTISQQRIQELQKRIILVCGQQVVQNNEQTNCLLKRKKDLEKYFKDNDLSIGFFKRIQKGNGKFTLKDSSSYKDELLLSNSEQKEYSRIMKIQKKQQKQDKKITILDQQKQLIFDQWNQEETKINNQNNVPRECDICCLVKQNTICCYNQRCLGRYCRDCFQQSIQLQQGQPKCHCNEVFKSIQIMKMDKQYYQKEFKKTIKNNMYQQSQQLIQRRKVWKQIQQKINPQNLLYFKICCVLPIINFYENNQHLKQKIIISGEDLNKCLIDRNMIHKNPDIYNNFNIDPDFQFNKNDTQQIYQQDAQQGINQNRIYINEYFEIYKRLYYLQKLLQKESIYGLVKSFEIINYLKNNTIGIPKIQKNTHIDINLTIDEDKSYTYIYLQQYIQNYNQILQIRNLQQQQIGNDQQSMQLNDQNYIKTDLYICKCSDENCAGLINRNIMQCSICFKQYCQKCLMIHDQSSQCKQSDIDACQYLIEKCRMCPKCLTLISKVSGCDQMFCTLCHTAFDWNDSGKIYKNGIHNPEYFDMLKKKNGQLIQQNRQICGQYDVTDNQIQQILSLFRYVKQQLLEDQIIVFITGNYELNEKLNYIVTKIDKQRMEQLKKIETLFGLICQMGQYRHGGTCLTGIIDKYIDNGDRKKYEKYLWKIYREKEVQNILAPMQQQLLQVFRNHILYMLFDQELQNIDTDGVIDLFVQMINETNKELFYVSQYYKLKQIYLDIDSGNLLK